MGDGEGVRRFGGSGGLVKGTGFLLEKMKIFKIDGDDCHTTL